MIPPDVGRSEQLVATLLWKRVDAPGAEHCQLWTAAAGHRLTGAVLAVHDGEPLRLEYSVECSAGWETRRAAVVVWHGSSTRRMELAVDSERRWWADGVALPGVSGCVDVDLSLTPATNTLPVRRLGLLDVAIGAARDVNAAWVRFPDLSVELLPQRYTRIGNRRFHYESWSAGAEHERPTFDAEIEVDALGLVVSYPPAWWRAAGSSGSSVPVP